MKARIPLLIAGVSALSAPLPAQVAFEGEYTQDFDALANVGTANPWSNNTTLAGWYAATSLGAISTFAASTGSSTTGNLNSFGSTASTDRALGALPTNGTTGTPGPGAAYAFGVRLQNAAGVTLENFTVSFTGEQWRNAAGAGQSLTFWYQVGSNLTSPGPGSDAGWTAVPALTFISPVTGGTASAINGNLAGNRQEMGATLSGVTLAPDQELFLRWRDVNDSGNDHGLAIDDFSVTALAVVPEPSTWALLGGGLILLAHTLRRRK